jgi:hypothetical protein
MSGGTTMTMSGTELENIFFFLFFNYLIFICRGYIAPEILQEEEFIPLVIYLNILFHFIYLVHRLNRTFIV